MEIVRVVDTELETECENIKGAVRSYMCNEGVIVSDRTIGLGCQGAFSPLLYILLQSTIVDASLIIICTNTTALNQSPLNSSTHPSILNVIRQFFTIFSGTKYNVWPQRHYVIAMLHGLWKGP